MDRDKRNMSRGRPSVGETWGKKKMRFGEVEHVNKRILPAANKALGDWKSTRHQGSILFE